MLTAVRQWVIRTMMKSKGQTGVVQTIPRRDLVEINTQVTAQKLMQNGIDPEALKNADQVENAIIAIESRPKVQEGITSTKTAKIMDMEGKEIPKGSKIMGGKEVKDQKRFFKGVEIKDPTFDENLPFDSDAEKLAEIRMSNEAYEQEIAKRIGEGNKEAAKRLREKSIEKFEKDQDLKEVERAIDNMSPSLSGDTRTDAALVAEDLAEQMGKVYDDLPQMERLDLYDRAYTGLSAKRFKGFKKPKDSDPEDMAQGGRAGFFMGSLNPKGLGLLRQLLNFFGKKSKVIKNPSDALKVVNPKAFNKMLEDAKGKIIPKEGIMATDRVKGYQTQMAKDRIDVVNEMLEKGKRFKAADDKIVAYENEIKEKFMKDLNMSEADAENAANKMAKLAMDVTKMEKTPKITEEGLLQLENVLKNMETGGKKARDLNADGGRIGFKNGMTRRTFLKIFGGLVSLPIIGKIVKPIKLATGVKKVPIIKTDNVPGKPEWFDQLVNKVIIEGEDVTKKFATKEREIVHMKVLDEGTGGKKYPPGTPAADDTSIIVTQDLDNGAIRVEYRNPENMYGDPVQLQYKKPLPDEGDPRPAAEFDTAESYPVGRAFGPDDYEIEIDEISGTSIRDLTSDVSKLKEYATGKKPTLKEIVQTKKRKDKAKAISEGGENEQQAVIDRQGEFIQFDDLDPGDYASGGIARMLGE